MNDLHFCRVLARDVEDPITSARELAKLASGNSLAEAAHLRELREPGSSSKQRLSELLGGFGIVLGYTLADCLEVAYRAFRVDYFPNHDASSFSASSWL